MLDISKTIESRSDQINAIDLIGGPVTITVTDVKMVAGDQPVAIYYENCGERLFKPCKSMRRVLVMAWSKDADTWIGRSMTLYQDLSVKWAGSEVSGTRISHLSHIDKPLRCLLTVSRGKTAPCVIQPLVTFAGNPLPPETFEAIQIDIVGCMTMAELSVVGAKIKSSQYDADGAAKIRVPYQAAVDRIRNEEAEVDNPEASQDSEGSDASE